MLSEITLSLAVIQLKVQQTSLCENYKRGRKEKEPREEEGWVGETTDFFNGIFKRGVQAGGYQHVYVQAEEVEKA